MLNQNEFCVKVEREFISYLSKSFKTGNYMAQNTEDNLSVHHVNPEKDLIDAPVIDLRGIYKIYKGGGGNFEDTVKSLAESYENAYRGAPLKELNTKEKKDSAISVPSEVNEDVIDISKVFFQAVNKDNNKERIEQLPYTDKGEVALVYRQFVNMSEDGVSSFIINNEMLAVSGMTLSDIEGAALINTPVLFPVEVTKVSDIPMFSITNSIHAMGGSVIYYPESPLADIAEQLKSDLIVIPDNVHEVLAIDAKGEDTKFMMEELSSVISVASTPAELMCNNALLYIKDTKELVNVIDNSIPSKSMEVNINRR